MKINELAKKMVKGYSNYEMELETKDCLILACIFAAAGHVIATVICLGLMLVSAHNDHKKANI